jgi:hypothetical protein
MRQHGGLFDSLVRLSHQGLTMNGFDFNNCKAFLEFMIQQHPENAELVKAYMKLIEKKTEFDIAVSSHNAEVQKNWENSQKEITKNWQSTQAEVTKESIKKGNQPFNL